MKTRLFPLLFLYICHFYYVPILWSLDDRTPLSMRQKPEISNHFFGDILFKRDAPLISALNSSDLYSNSLKESIKYFFQIDLFRPDIWQIHGWIVSLFLIIFIVSVYIIRNHKKETRYQEIWTIVEVSPASIGVLVSIIICVPFLSSLPRTWKLTFWVLVVLATYRIVSAHLPQRWQKRVIAVIVIPYLILLVLEIIEVSLIFLRIYLILIALLGIPVNLRLARYIKNFIPRQVIYSHIFRVASFLFFIILLCQIFGFNILASHLYESSVKTVFLILFFILLLRFIQSVITVFFSLPLVSRTSILTHNKDIIKKRLYWILKIIIGYIVVILFFTIWGLNDSPFATLKTVNNIGFSVGAHRFTLGLFLLSLIVLLLAFYSSQALQRILFDQIYPHRKIEPGIGSAINKLIHYGFIIIGFFWIISILGFDLQNFAIIGGALGIGVGFGLQNIVSNFVSGLVLLIERPVKVGDVVVVNEIWGEIVKVGLRSTVVLTYDRSEIIIPNSDLITNQIVNWTRLNRSARLKIPVGVAYESDVSFVIKVLTDIAAQHPLTLKEPPPKVIFVSYGDSSLNFELWLWLADLSDRLMLKTEIMEQIVSRFREEKITIPFPQRDLHVKDKPEQT